MDSLVNNLPKLYNVASASNMVCAVLTFAGGGGIFVGSITLTLEGDKS